ncbi:N-6 DNA methylase [Streptomyces griseoviridis]
MDSIRSKPLTVERLDTFLRKTVELVHDEINASEVAQYVGPLLLLKLISDQPDLLALPDEARWRHVAHPGDLRPGDSINRALHALENSDPDLLQDVFRTVDFNKPSTERAVARLIRHIDDLSLDDDTLEFGDEVGRAFDRFLAYTISSAGSRGPSDFYTPRAVCQLMAELVQPEQEHTVADPHSGSGGMLLSAMRHVAAHSTSQASLHLYGQERNLSAWSTGKINLLLHRLFSAELFRGDTLAEPSLSGHELRRFDRVLTAPSFSIKYNRDEVRYPERMKYGWTPEGKADLMFVQHVLSVLRPDGLGAVVTPHGVLFRGGAESKIRQGIIEDDRLEAVIGVGANVFYNTGIPACILVLRGAERRPADRRGQVLFINAEHEVTVGRSKNRLEAQHVAKIADAFLGWRNVPGFSRAVSLKEIKDHDYNLNIRRYVNSDPPDEPLLDITAALRGGVPWPEIDSEADRFLAFGIDARDLFRPLRPGYSAFPPEGYEAAASHIPDLAATKEDEFRRTVHFWWTNEYPFLRDLAHYGRLPLSEVRSHLEESFCNALLPLEILDRFQLLGVLASWWSEREDDFRALSRFGPEGVVKRRRLAPRTGISQTPPEREEVALCVFRMLGTDLQSRTEHLVAAERQKLVEAFLRWGERYAVSMEDLEGRYRKAADRLRDQMADLGYF